MEYTITVNGRNLNKLEFFDLVYDTFIEADYACTEEQERRYIREFSVMRNVLRMYGWMEEYQQWIAEGAGTKEAAEELRELK